MRHEDISTTMKYYVGQDADAMADTLWAAVGDTLVDTPSRDSSPTGEKRLESKGNRVDRGGIEPPTPGFSGDFLSTAKREVHSAFTDVFCNCSRTIDDYKPLQKTTLITANHEPTILQVGSLHAWLWSLRTPHSPVERRSR
jgi:hypothetical protein